MSTARSSGRTGRRAVLMLVSLLLLMPELALLGFFTVDAALSAPAGTPHLADVVVVLGGGTERCQRGRDLMLAGHSKRLLLIHSSEQERKEARRLLPDAEMAFEDEPRNTWQEAKSVRATMQPRGWHTARVVSDPPHLLRVAYAWSSAFRGTDLSYTLISSDPPWWPGWRWWSNPTSARFVESEVLKLGYYLLRYPFGFDLAWIAALRSQ